MRKSLFGVLFIRRLLDAICASYYESLHPNNNEFCNLYSVHQWHNYRSNVNAQFLIRSTKINPSPCLSIWKIQLENLRYIPFVNS